MQGGATGGCRDALYPHSKFETNGSAAFSEIF